MSEAESFHLQATQANMHTLGIFFAYAIRRLFSHLIGIYIIP